MLPVLAEYQAPVVLMHNRLQMRSGQPYRDLVGDIVAELRRRACQPGRPGLADKTHHPGSGHRLW